MCIFGQRSFKVGLPAWFSPRTRKQRKFKGIFRQGLVACARPQTWKIWERFSYISRQRKKQRKSFALVKFTSKSRIFLPEIEKRKKGGKR